MLKTLFENFEQSNSRSIIGTLMPMLDLLIKTFLILYCSFFIHLCFSRTALHWACKEGYLDIATLLLTNGADKNLRSEIGETPASVCSNQQILYLLSTNDDFERIMYDLSLRTVTSPPDFLRATANSSKIRNNIYDRNKLVTSFQDGLINLYMYIISLII